MRSKLKWGQQNNNVICVVNLGAEGKRFTHKRCKVLTQCQFLKRGGGGGGMGASPKYRMCGKCKIEIRQKSQNFSTNDAIRQNR